MSKNDSAFPVDEESSFDGEPCIKIKGGLTKREYFAAKAMQGLMSNPTFGIAYGTDGLVRRALIVADAMLLHLEQSDG